MILNEMRCKFSKIKLKPFMSFGKMPMANGFLSKKDFHKEFFYNLEVGFNKKIIYFRLMIILSLHIFLIIIILFTQINRGL